MVAEGYTEWRAYRVIVTSVEMLTLIIRCDNKQKTVKAGQCLCINNSSQSPHQNSILIIRNENGWICSSKLSARNAGAEPEGEYNPGGMSH